MHLHSALAYEPLYLLGRVGTGCELCSLGRVDQGHAELEHVLRIDPQFGPALGHLGREYALCGRVRDAETLAAQAYASIPQHPNAVGFLAGMHARAGNRLGSAQLLQTLAGESQWSLPRTRAEAHLLCGELDAALDCVAEAITNRDPGIWILFPAPRARGCANDRAGRRSDLHSACPQSRTSRESSTHASAGNIELKSRARCPSSGRS